MTWFDLMQLHVTGSLNVSDGGNGSEKAVFENNDSRDEGRRSLCFVFVKFGNPASEEHFEYNFECNSTMRVCTMECMSKVVSDVLGDCGVIYRI